MDRQKKKKKKGGLGLGSSRVPEGGPGRNKCHEQYAGKEGRKRKGRKEGTEMEKRNEKLMIRV